MLLMICRKISYNSARHNNRKYLVILMYHNLVKSKANRNCERYFFLNYSWEDIKPHKCDTDKFYITATKIAIFPHYFLKKILIFSNICLISNWHLPRETEDLRMIDML